MTDVTQTELAAWSSPALGQAVWGTTLGVGSFLTFELGSRREPDTSGQGRPHGEFHVWVYCSAWRIETTDTVVASSEDDRDVLVEAVRHLDGRTLTAIDVEQPSLSAAFRFSDGTTLRTFSIFSDGYEHWMLYLPDGRVVTAGPGRALTVGT